MRMRLNLPPIFVIARSTTAIGIVTLIGSTVVLGQDAPVRAGIPGAVHPRIVEAVPPVYPPFARSARVQGNVTIEALIDARGLVENAAVTSSIPLLDVAAIDAVRKWHFEPPLANGRPVRFSTTVTLRFQLFDALVPVPLPGSKRMSASEVPIDFAVVYEPRCPTMVTLSTATHDLEPVYRALFSAGLLTRTEGLHMWDDASSPTARISDNGVEMTIAGESPRVDCSGRPDIPVLSLQVRSGGTWRQLWPRRNPSLLPRDYGTQLGPALALLKEMVDGQQR